MPAKKNSVTTPLHLLQQLSHSLIKHLEKACKQSLKDAEASLPKLEKQRGKTQERLVKARAKLDEAGAAGKTKAQAKAREKVGELEEMLALLQARQSETLIYLNELRHDAEHSLKLAQGIVLVEEAAAHALALKARPAATVVKQPAPRRMPRRVANVAALLVEAEGDTPADVAANKAPARITRRPVSTEPTPAAAKKPAPRKPAARKPAAEKPSS